MWKKNTTRKCWYKLSPPHSPRLQHRPLIDPSSASKASEWGLGADVDFSMDLSRNGEVVCSAGGLVVCFWFEVKSGTQLMFFLKNHVLVGKKQPNWGKTAPFHVTTRSKEFFLVIYIHLSILNNLLYHNKAEHHFCSSQKIWNMWKKNNLANVCQRTKQVLTISFSRLLQRTAHKTHRLQRDFQRPQAGAPTSKELQPGKRTVDSKRVEVASNGGPAVALRFPWANSVWPLL